MVMLLIVSILFSQKEYCYTEAEVQEIYSIIHTCDYNDSLNTEIQTNLENQIQNSEQLILNNEFIIQELEKQLDLKDDLIEAVKPKWHENKYLWFSYGLVAIILPTWVLGNVN